MERIQYDRYGGLEQLKLAEVAQPVPGSGQVLIRVEAASVNPMDGKIRRGEMKMLTGRRFPRGLGHDFAGVVIAVGPDVTDRKVGDEVMGVTTIGAAGTFAEAVLADAKTTVIKPSALSFEQAAALTLVGVTAWTGLITKSKLKSGQTVFISGCMGAVGRCAIQIARIKGARVVGSCSASDHDEARALGADEIIDYRVFDPASYPRRFDVVLDTAGSLSLRDCGRMLKQGGKSLHIVPTFGKMIGSLLSSRHNIVFGNATPEALTGIANAAEGGRLLPAIGRTAPLRAAIQAIAEQEKTGLPKGKLVITLAS